MEEQIKGQIQGIRNRIEVYIQSHSLTEEWQNELDTYLERLNFLEEEITIDPELISLSVELISIELSDLLS